MKRIQSATLLLVDPDEHARTALGEELRALGLARLFAVASLDEARALVEQGGIDACIVAVEAHGSGRDATGLDAAPGAGAAIPSLLVASTATRGDLRQATAAGYAGVLPRPLVPRLVYRRVGSVLQRARRRSRTQLASLAGAQAGRDGADATD